MYIIWESPCKRCLALKKGLRSTAEIEISNPQNVLHGLYYLWYLLLLLLLSDMSRRLASWTVRVLFARTQLLLLLLSSSSVQRVRYELTRSVDASAARVLNDKYLCGPGTRSTRKYQFPYLARAKPGRYIILLHVPALCVGSFVFDFILGVFFFFWFFRFSPPIIRLLSVSRRFSSHRGCYGRVLACLFRSIIVLGFASFLLTTQTYPFSQTSPTINLYRKSIKMFWNLIIFYLG